VNVNVQHVIRDEALAHKHIQVQPYTHALVNVNVQHVVRDEALAHAATSYEEGQAGGHFGPDERHLGAQPKLAACLCVKRSEPLCLRGEVG
jgi:hypothetical protein